MVLNNPSFESKPRPPPRATAASLVSPNPLLVEVVIKLEGQLPAGGGRTGVSSQSRRRDDVSTVVLRLTWCSLLELVRVTVRGGILVKRTSSMSNGGLGISLAA